MLIKLQLKKLTEPLTGSFDRLAQIIQAKIDLSWIKANSVT